VVLLCSDGLTSMISEDRVREVLSAHDNLDAAADALIHEANEAGGRDNITVVLFRLEELGGDGGSEEETMVGVAVPHVGAGDEDTDPEGPAGEAARTTAEARSRGGVAVAPAPTHAALQRSPPPPSTRRLEPIPPVAHRPERRFGKPLAALLAIVIVLALIGGAGYLASRQLYFVGTNAQGIVTIYRGFPYDLPFGVPLYETYYVSGVPASTVSAARRTQLLNNNLRSQSDATSLVMDLEQGRISP
jgi:protein phosphatase